MTKPVYRPTIGPVAGNPEALEQVFRAREIVVQEETEFALVGFTDSVHSLLVTIPFDATDDSLCVEFNDQGNSRFGSEVLSSALDPGALVVTFAPASKVEAGRISYMPEADPCSGPARFPQFLLSRVVVQFEESHEQVSALRSQLFRIAELGCEFVGPAV